LTILATNNNIYFEFIGPTRRGLDIQYNCEDLSCMCKCKQCENISETEDIISFKKHHVNLIKNLLIGHDIISSETNIKKLIDILSKISSEYTTPDLTGLQNLQIIICLS
jgi:hypothetical protein